jgi:hypothetical protein
MWSSPCNKKTALGSGKSFGSHRSFQHETLPQLWHLFLAQGRAASQMHPYVSFFYERRFYYLFQNKMVIFRIAI